MNMPNNIEIGKVFIIKKGNRSARWKIIEHPYFDNAYALIADHPYLSYNFKTEDYKHIVYGGNSIEKTWESAYNHT